MLLAVYTQIGSGRGVIGVETRRTCRGLRTDTRAGRPYRLRRVVVNRRVRLNVLHSALGDPGAVTRTRRTLALPDSTATDCAETTGTLGPLTASLDIDHHSSDLGHLPIYGGRAIAGDYPPILNLQAVADAGCARSIVGRDHHAPVAVVFVGR